MKLRYVLLVLLILLYCSGWLDDILQMLVFAAILCLVMSAVASITLWRLADAGGSGGPSG